MAWLRTTHTLIHSSISLNFLHHRLLMKLREAFYFTEYVRQQFISVLIRCFKKKEVSKRRLAMMKLLCRQICMKNINHYCEGINANFTNYLFDEFFLFMLLLTYIQTFLKNFSQVIPTPLVRSFFSRDLSHNILFNIQYIKKSFYHVNLKCHI